MLILYQGCSNGLGNFPGNPYHTEVHPRLQPKKSLAQSVQNCLQVDFKKQLAAMQAADGLKSVPYAVMLLALLKIILTVPYISIYCLCLCYYNISTLLYVLYTHTYIYIYMYSCGGAPWWAIYRIQIGHPSGTYDWLLIYIIYTKVDTYAHKHILQ